MEVRENKNFSDVPYAKNAGPILRGLLNGVKQTSISFADIHNLDPVYLEAVMNGKKPLTSEIVNAVDNHSPLDVRKLFDPNHRHKFKIKDDTNDGVLIFTAEQRKETQRTFMRGQSDGQKVPYYDYGDTAMSKTSTFRPEWIVERYVHDGNDANVPDWAFNKGHFEYQITYFIGTVNFYWIDKKGNKHVRKMNTGDINYITPFVPHTFTTREEGKGLILAVTYGGAVATDEFQTKIKSMDLDDYQSSYKKKLPKVEENLVTDELEGVIVRKNKDASSKENDAYKWRELINGIPNQPHTKAFEYIVKRVKEERTLDINVDADRWGYNVGNTPVMFLWRSNEQILKPGTSFFIQPNVPHSFRNTGDKEGKLIVMEIKPEEGDPLKDLALIYKYSGQEGLERVHTESTRWF